MKGTGIKGKEAISPTGIPDPLRLTLPKNAGSAVWTVMGDPLTFCAKLP